MYFLFFKVLNVAVEVYFVHFIDMLINMNVHLIIKKWAEKKYKKETLKLLLPKLRRFDDLFQDVFIS